MPPEDFGQRELDPLNRGFVWRRRKGPFRRLTMEQAEQFNDLGYVVLRRAIPPETLERVRTEIDRAVAGYEGSLPTGSDDFGTRPGTITFDHHVVVASPVVRDFAASGLFANLGHDLLGPDVRLYWDQAIYKKSMCDIDVPWHQDTGYVFTEPQDYLTCWVPLVDVDEENGCLWVKPGQHLRGTLRPRMTRIGYTCGNKDDAGVPLPLEAGDLVALTALLPHRSGPNRTDTTRKAYLLQYAVDGTRILRDPQGRLVDEPCDAMDRQFLVVKNGSPSGASA